MTATSWSVAPTLPPRPEKRCGLALTCSRGSARRRATAGTIRAVRDPCSSADDPAWTPPLQSPGSRTLVYLKSNTRIRGGLGVRPRAERRSCGILARLFSPASSSIRILRRNASPRPPRSTPWVWLPRRAVSFRGNIQLVDHRDLAVFSSGAKGGAAVWVWR